MNAPTLFGPDGEPCASCGTPLAADQRYCLSCGARRADARLPFLDILREEPPTLVPFATAVHGAPPVAEAGLAARARENTGLIASVGVLLIAMLIGVLIGSGFGNDDSDAARASAANQKPIVVSVGQAAAAPAAAAATTDTTATDPTDGSPSSTTSKGSADSASKSDASSKADEAKVKPKAVSQTKLKSLDKLSGKDYQKQVDKLGKNIATGGKAPPKDNKPAAGGGDFEDIG